MIKVAKKEESDRTNTATDRRSGSLILIALTFLSALPVKVRIGEGDLGRSMRYFPLIGLMFGAVLSAAVWALSYFLLLGISAIALLLISVILSRGMHLDAVADSADGLFGGFDKESSLRIMSDSSVGAFGAAGIVLVLLAKYSLFGLIAAASSLWPVLILAPAWGRWAAVYGAYRYPPAKSEGMAATFAISATGKEVAIATVVAVVATLLLLPIIPSLVMIFWSAATVFLSAHMLTKKIGGISGDILGTIIETTEIIFLLGAIIFIRSY